MTPAEYTMPRAIGLRRISKDRGDDNLGLSAQTAAIKAEAGRLGLPLIAVFTDAGVSGGAAPAKRPGLLDALAELKAGDVLVIARRDRLARDLMIAGWIEKEVKRRGATIISAAGEANGDTNDPYANALRQIIDVFAELERGVIRARTTAALAVKKAAGRRWCNDAPYGFRWTADGAIAENVAEQRTIKLVHELRDAGLAYRGIVAELRRRRRVNRAGNPFQLSQIQRILAAK